MRVRAHLARLRADLAAALTARYRRALAAGSSELRLYLALAGALERVAALRGSVSRLRSGARAPRREQRGDGPSVLRVVVTATGELTLTLAVPDGGQPTPDAVAALGANAVPTPLPTTVVPRPDGVHLVAGHVPAGTRQVVLTSGPARTPLVTVDVPPVVPGAEGFRACLGLTSLHVRWPDAGTELELRPADGGAPVRVYSTTEHGPDGAQRAAVVDLAVLASRSATAWTAHAGDAPLREPVGSRPWPAEPRHVLVRDEHGTYHPVSVRQSPDGALLIDVGTGR